MLLHFLIFEIQFLELYHKTYWKFNFSYVITHITHNLGIFNVNNLYRYFIFLKHFHIIYIYVLDKSNTFSPRNATPKRVVIHIISKWTRKTICMVQCETHWFRISIANSLMRNNLTCVTCKTRRWNIYVC